METGSGGSGDRPEKAGQPLHHATRKRLLFEKISRCKEKKLLRFVSHQVEYVPERRLAYLVKKTPITSKPVRKLIGEDGPVKGGRTASTEAAGLRGKRRRPRGPDSQEYDTDYEDLDMETKRPVDQHHLRWVNYKMPFEAFDLSLQRIIEDRQERCRILQAQIDSMSLELDSTRQNPEEGSARTCGFDFSSRHHRPKCTLFDPGRERVDYSLIEPCTSSSLSASRTYFQHAHPNTTLMPDLRRVTEHMETHLHRLAIMPRFLVRSRWDAPSRTAEDIEEERQRNGVRRQLEREKRRQKEIKERGKDEKAHHKEDTVHKHSKKNNHNAQRIQQQQGDSSDWEDTDEDDFYVPKKKSGASRNNKRANNSHRRGGGSKDDDVPDRLDRRGSMVQRQSNRWELEEVMPEITTAQLPQKFDYKEILVPSWTRFGPSELSPIYDCNPVPGSCEFCQTKRRLEQLISDDHKKLEDEERKRFQAILRKRAEQQEAKLLEQTDGCRTNGEAALLPPLTSSSIPLSPHSTTSQQSPPPNNSNHFPLPAPPRPHNVDLKKYSHTYHFLKPSVSPPPPNHHHPLSYSHSHHHNVLTDHTQQQQQQQQQHGMINGT